MTGDVYVVVYGTGRHIDDVHGVFGEKKRAELAAQELQRVYDEPKEWVDVESHEFVTQATEDFEVSDSG